MGRRHQAAAIFEKAAQRAKRTPDPDLDEWIRAVNGLARCSLATGSPADALAFGERALEIADKRWGRGSIPALDTLDTLGMVDLAQSKLDDAERLFGQILKAREAMYGPEHVKVAESYMHAALCRSAKRDHAGAIEFGTRALDMYQHIFGGTNAHAVLALVPMAKTYAAAGRAEDAKKCLVNAASGVERIFGPVPVLEEIRKGI
jgi:tetratricopeptide (TPR) repeat protein